MEWKNCFSFNIGHLMDRKRRLSLEEGGRRRKVKGRERGEITEMAPFPSFLRQA